MDVSIWRESMGSDGKKRKKILKLTPKIGIPRLTGSRGANGSRRIISVRHSI
jgi:hypothetical protein